MLYNNVNVKRRQSNTLTADKDPICSQKISMVSAGSILKRDIAPRITEEMKEGFRERGRVLRVFDLAAARAHNNIFMCSSLVPKTHLMQSTHQLRMESFCVTSLVDSVNIVFLRFCQQELDHASPCGIFGSDQCGDHWRFEIKPQRDGLNVALFGEPEVC